MNQEELFQALMSSNLEALATALKNGADVNAQDKDGKTLIYKAIETNNAKAVELLLQYHADYETKDFKGYLPTDSMYEEVWQYGYVTFILKKRWKPIESLLKANLNGIAFLNKKSLFSAALDDSLARLKDAIRNGGVWDVNIRLQDGTTPLHLAAKKGHTKLANALLEEEKKITEKNGKSTTIPFVDSQDSQGKTALHYAVENNFPKIIELLLAFNASIQVTDKEGNLPANLAADAKIKDLLTQKYAHPEEKKKTNPNNLSPIEMLEKKITENIIRAIKNEYQYGNALGKKLENMMLYAEEGACVSIYVNDKALIKLSGEEIEKKFRNNTSALFSSPAVQRIEEVIFTLDDTEEVNKLTKDSFKPSMEFQSEAMTGFMHRICAQLEENKSLFSNVPVGNNLIVFFNEKGTIHFNFRKKAKQLVHTPISDYLKILSQ